MAPRVPIKNSDLRGAARLATDATAGLTSLVEAMHERIVRVPLVTSGRLDGRTGGITGLVYKTIRGVTRVVGGSIEALLGLIAPALAGDDPVPEREALIAALNGVLGDYLAATTNPLATPMALRRGGVTLTLEADALAKSLPDASGQVLVLMHGLCMNDLQWLREGHDHGAALSRDLGLTPVYLHYNSGLHVSINGHALAQMLERLVEQWPQPVQRIVLLGHSMGGLLARSALHYGALAGLRWRSRVSDAVFLGTPHHGAPLERAGNWVDIVLGATPYAAPFARLGKLRSAGITDLRHGNVLDEDWVGRDRFAHRTDRRLHIPLPTDLRCFAIAATIGQRDGDVKDRLLGDGLVPLDSALGQHRLASRCLKFDAGRQWIGYGMHHLDLLNHTEVYAQLRRWLGGPGV
ncbi:MAG: GPI inositol-deacylase [Aquincola sp.]|nr:GPI inositol-deacylase [Aquincola sp.]MDH4288011.1 GPI inositol-deacylase [Aquincola sp.]MDH5328411.1 GPI inositol-deacylase [Aquincola sp.]